MAVLNVKWERCSQMAQLWHPRNMSDMVHHQKSEELPTFSANQKMNYVGCWLRSLIRWYVSDINSHCKILLLGQLNGVKTHTDGHKCIRWLICIPTDNMYGQQGAVQCLFVVSCFHKHLVMHGMHSEIRKYGLYKLNKLKWLIISIPQICFSPRFLQFTPIHRYTRRQTAV